jgi:hypothetical protein
MTDDISEIETEEVSAFLPEPVKGRRGGITFPVYFSDYMCVKVVFYLLLLFSIASMQFTYDFNVSFFILG